MFKVKTLLIGLLFLSSFAVGLQPATAQFFRVHPLVGQKAPSFTLDSTKEGIASLEAIIKDKKAIIFFWATWCPHCVDQIKQLDAQKDIFKANGISFILVDIGEKANQVNAFLKKKGYDFNVFLDQKSSVARDYKVVGVPTMAFVGKDGVVRAVENGFPSNYLEILK